MATHKIKQAVSNVLSYFAVVANAPEQSEERKEFSRNAGKWITDSVEKLSNNEIIGRNMAGVQEERKNALEARYDLASRAFHYSQNSLNDAIREATKIMESDYHGGWSELKKTLEKDVAETLKLADDVESIYSRQNALIMELAGRELVGNPEEKIDNAYVQITLGAIGAANATVGAQAQTVLGHELSQFGHVYERIEPSSFSTKVESSGNRLNGYNVEFGALFAAVTELCGNGKKVSRDEFTDKVSEYKQKLGDAMEEIKAQREAALLGNPQPAAFVGQNYTSPMYG